MANNLLVYGNAKLGALSNFPLPAFTTCSGRNEFCDRYCYGVKNWYRERRVVESASARYARTLLPNFIPEMVSEIRKSGVKVVRIHTVGDFYNVSYIHKWASIVSECDETAFYGYTRAWRSLELRELLEELMCLAQNLHLRASVDFTHEDRPIGWKLFSVVNGEGLRCPHDLGKVAFCRDCGLCWSVSSPKSIWTKLRWSCLRDNQSIRLL